ncbi:uncharacterized protein LOC114258365 [Camellia sinensis]|uniref:uncharacterized protein LOC114258365 n=1 Tax=Camellia sinensis TaxID=4442 RepID=UPI0010356AC9|nr:uncharacterized protein LOC114258365 [Camellia sinensis]
MGLVFGKIDVETPKFELIKSTNDYEIHKYSPSVIAEVTYDPTHFKGNKDGGFMISVNYIGIVGNPQNSTLEKITMAAPVITQSSPEKIPMTAPVVMKEVEDKEKKMMTMQFILPEKYRKADEALRLVDERVMIREKRERKYGVVKFGGVATEEVVVKKVEELRKGLERDVYKVIGEFLVAMPAFRTNEVLLPIE